MPIYDPQGNLISKAGPTKQQLDENASTIRKIYGRNRVSEFNEYSVMFPFPASLGRIGYNTLRYLYETSSSVRPAVDSIVREVSGTPWTIAYRDQLYHSDADIDRVEYFLRNVNLDDEDLTILISKFVNDLLVVGKGVIEKVRPVTGNGLVELVARDAALFQPLRNREGTGIAAYVEMKYGSTQIHDYYSKQDLIYRLYTPVSYAHMPLPIIETIINEISLLMLTVKNIAWNFMNDEIPPGLLHLGNIGEVALNRAKESFQAARGPESQSKLRVVDNVDKAAWIQFTRPFREMQVAELIPIIERIVARNFGRTASEEGITDSGRGTPHGSENESQNRLIVPLTNMIAQAFTRKVVSEFNSELSFTYVHAPLDSLETITGSLLSLQRGGIYSRNEVRAALGQRPIKGGDVRTVILGNEVVPIDDEGLPIYRNPAVGADGGESDGVVVPPPSAQAAAERKRKEEEGKKPKEEKEEDDEQESMLDGENLTDALQSAKTKRDKYRMPGTSAYRRKIQQLSEEFKITDDQVTAMLED